jgi:hypothetical protein
LLLLLLLRLNPFDGAADLRRIVPHGDFDRGRSTSSADHQRAMLKVEIAKFLRLGTSAIALSCPPIRRSRNSVVDSGRRFRSSAALP